MKKIFFYILFALTPIGLAAQIQVTVNVVQPFCTGYTNGEATAAVTGGTAPYSYAWSNGQNGQATSNLKAGDYMVTVTDAAAKTAIKAFSVAQPAPLIAISTQTGAACANNISFTGSATGGNAPYTFTWRNLDNGQLINSANLTNPLRASYFLEVKDAKGCTANKVVNVNGNLAVTVKVADVICGGMCDGAVEALVTGGATPYTYKWNYQDKTTQALTPVPGGTYTVTVTDANGCQKIATGTVFEPVELKANASVTGECTNSATGKVVPTGGRLPYAIKWSNGATGATAAGLTLGIYFVTVTDANGCNASAQVNVSKKDPLQIILMSKLETCKDAAVEVCVPGGGLGPYTFQWSNGRTSQVEMNLLSGTYRVTATDAAGCRDSAQITIDLGTKQVKLTPTVTNSLCNRSTGTASVDNPTGGTAPYTYKWSNNQTTSKITGLAGGVYSVIVTDALGCVANATLTVGTEGGINAVAFAKTDASCNGFTNGSATVTATGTGPFNYVWSTGATTQTISNIAAGTYKVSVSNAAGCNIQSEVTVGNVKNLIMTTGSSNAECSAATGTAFVKNIVGGVGPFAFKWNNNQTTQTATGLSAGTYSVIVTDAEGCQVSANGIVVTANGSAVSLSLAKTDASCSGVSNGSIVSTATGIAPFTYKWSNNATTKDLTNIIAGTYSVTLTDAAGCKAESQITLIDSRVLKITTGSSNSACDGNTGTAFVSNIIGGVGPYTFIWNNGQTTQTATNLPAGAYHVTVSDAQGCSVPASNIRVVANGGNIVATSVVTDATCNNKNGKIVFTPTGGTAPYTYKWSGGTNTDSLAAGSYVFTITDAKGCAKAETIAVNNRGLVKAAFTNTPTIDATTCNSDSISTKLTSTSTGALAGATYKWSYPTNRTSTEASPTIKLAAGTNMVQLIVTGAEGCSDTIRSNIVINLPKINADVQDSAMTCQGAAVSLLAKNNNTAFPVTYKWSPDSLIVSGGTTATPSVKGNGTGARKVYVTISNAVGCSKLDSVIFNTIAKDALKPSDITFKQDCDTRKISFTNNSALADQYTWRFGDAANPNAGSSDKNPIYTYSQGGTYSVTLIPKMACLDTVKFTVPVRTNAAVSVVANKDTSVCSPAALSLKATSATAIKYEWSINPNFVPVISISATTNVMPSNGNNRYYVRATDSAGCAAMDTVIVSNNALNVSADTAVNACKTVDKTISLINGNAGDTLKVTWTPATAIVGSNTGKDVTIKTSTDLTLTAQVSNQFGCTRTLTIPVRAREVDAKVNVDANFIYLDDKVVLNAEPSGTGFTYKWTPPTDVENADKANTKASPKQDTKFVVEVTDQYGCKDTASVTVKVLIAECKEPYIFVPRAFSPNNDNLNEKVFVRGDYLLEEGFEFAIYNRWGERVFFSNNREEGWDGTVGTKGVCPDVYGYYVKGKCRKGEVYFKKGNITVLK